MLIILPIAGLILEIAPHILLKLRSNTSFLPIMEIIGRYEILLEVTAWV